MEQELENAEFKYDLQLFAKEGEGEQEGEGEKEGGDADDKDDKKDEIEELKKSADEILDKDEFEKDAAKALLNTLFENKKVL